MLLTKNGVLAKVSCSLRHGVAKVLHLTCPAGRAALHPGKGGCLHPAVCAIATIRAIDKPPHRRIAQPVRACRGLM